MASPPRRTALLFQASADTAHLKLVLASAFFHRCRRSVNFRRSRAACAAPHGPIWNALMRANSACVVTGVNPCNIGVHAPVNFSSDRNGAVYGGGIEYHLPGTGWLLGAEYLRYDL